MTSVRKRKAGAVRFAHQHGIAVPRRVVPRLPGEGKQARELYRRIQRWAHYTPTGTWGPHLEALVFPPAQSEAKRWRLQIVANARFLIANRARVFYSMSGVRSHWLDEPYHALPITTDCSMAVKFCYRMPPGEHGPPDPTGEGWGHLGYTGDMLRNAQHITQAAALAGDFAVISKYGDDDGSHAVLLLVNGDSGPEDSLAIFSHGGSGPYAAREETMGETIAGHVVNGHRPHVSYLRVIQ